MSFGISNNIRSKTVQVCTRELFKAAIESPTVVTICAEIEDALEQCRRGELSTADYNTKKAELKKRLPVFTPHATFTSGRRCNADAIPSGLAMYDIDHIAAPEEYYKENIARHVSELGIVLAHVTPSLEGLRLFFVMPQGMTLAEAQEWMSFQLHNKNYDSSVKDYARSSFVVPRHYILYINETELFAERTTPTAVASSAANGSTTPAANGGIALAANGSIAPSASSTAAPTGSQDAESINQNAGQGGETPCFGDIPYKAIIDEWLRSEGEPTPGERNTKLHKLAYHLRYITDDDEALLLKIIPRYGLPESEMKALIHSALVAKRSFEPRKITEAVRRAKDTLLYGEAEEADDTPPPMPERLPPLIELLTSRTPDIYKPAVAHAVFPSLAAHLHRVRFEYINGVEHEATLMNVLMAGTGAGKDCITQPINRIMADIRRRDSENLAREEAWKNEMMLKGANKDKRKRPEGLIIQEIDADMTNPAFVMRMAEADGHFLYTKMNEIDQFDALKGNGRANQQFQIMCLAFDPFNSYGQTRVGTQSVTKRVTIRFNFNASTTIHKGRTYFHNVLTDGPVSRLNFCTIPEQEIGGEMPVYGRYTAEFDEQLHPYIERLVSASGLIDIPQANALALELKEYTALEATMTQSRAYENFSFRAMVIAWLKACVLYVAQGCRWDETIEAFVRWSLEYDLWCKMRFFGEDIDAVMEDSSYTPGHKPGPPSLLDNLPEKFTFTDAVAMRKRFGKNVRGTKKMINNWVARKLVQSVGKTDSDSDSIKIFIKTPIGT